MYSTKPNLLLAFHGCEKSDQERLITDISYFKKSQEAYDWLGHGMYFWDGNEKRALIWADKKKKAGTLKEPATIGAVLDLVLQLLNSLTYFTSFFPFCCVKLFVRNYCYALQSLPCIKKKIMQNIGQPI